MKGLVFLFCILLLSIAGFSQKVSDILDNGIVVKKAEKIYLLKKGDGLQFSVGNSNNYNFLNYEDSSIFLLHNNGVNVYLQPLNPLRYAYSLDTKYIPDPVYAEADKAFKSITDLLTASVGSNELKVGQPAGTKKIACDCPVCNFDTIKKNLVIIRDKLSADPKDSINAVFTHLRNLDFVDKASTYTSLDSADKVIERIANYFSGLNSNITALENAISSFKCNRDDSLVSKYVLIEILNDTKQSYATKVKRLKNLQQAYTLLFITANTASNGSKTAESWFGEPVFVPLKDKNIALFTVIINYGGAELKDGEIVATEKKEYFKMALRFRKWELFIPEVSAGIAYTDLHFPKYSITSDPVTGKNTVADAGQDAFKKVNFTAMINMVLYTRSSFRPFLQFGAGAKTDYPTIFTGVGVRFNVGLRTLALSVGGASTWIKQLNKYKVGDTIASEAELEKDMTYQFVWPKLYAGIQYNF